MAGLRSQKNTFFGKYLSEEVKFPSDDQPLLDKFPHREKAFQRANIVPIDYTSPFIEEHHEMSDMGEDRANTTRLRVLQNSTNLNFAKQADEDTTKGMLIGGAVGAGVGAAGSSIASSLAAKKVRTRADAALDFLGASNLKKYSPILQNELSKGITKIPLSLLTNPGALLKHPKELSFAEKVVKKIPLMGIPIAATTGAGMLAGGLASKFTSKGNQYDPYMGKYASEQHAFITETNVQPLPGHVVPDDIEDVVQLEHPALKYLPLTSGGLGIITGGILAKKLRGVSPTLNDIMLSGFLGTIGGTLAKHQLERKYAHPYMQKYVKDVDDRYLSKTSSEVAQEYISETGVPVLEKKNFPKNLEAVITFKNQLIDTTPTLATAAGMLIGHGLTKSPQGIVAGAALGGLAGTTARMIMIDKYIEPYRARFIQEVRNKYGLS